MTDGSPTAATEAAATFTTVLDDRALVRVSGPDARPFLHGLATQDVESLAPGELRYGALLTPQGRLLYDFFLLGETDAVLIDAPAAQRDALIARLTLYRLRAKVVIEPAEGRAAALWRADGSPPGGVGPGWTPDPRHSSLGLRSYGDSAATNVTAGDYQAHRLAFGAADPTRGDCDEKTYPIEANFDLLNGIDFHKGCFVGQETTSRMKRRGAIRTRLVPIVFDGPPPPMGAEVLAGQLRAGEVRSGMPGRALALLRLDRLAGAGLRVDGRPVRPDPPSWLAQAVQEAGIPDEKAHLAAL